MERTTGKQLEAMLGQVRELAIRAGVEGAGTWQVDEAAAYGGVAVSSAVDGGGLDYLGGGFMDANRMPRRYFVQALRMTRDVLERIPERADWPTPSVS